MDEPLKIKTAIVFDTNFIIEHLRDLEETLNKIPDEYDVYVTMISIEERISQRYLEQVSIYEKIKKFAQDNASYVSVKLRKTFEDRTETNKTIMLDSYRKVLGDNIIQYNPTENMFSEIIDRVYKKIPPFINVENASDKGFKDTLLWLSLLCFFKETQDYKEVIFISNDKVFINYSDKLKEEFSNRTGKVIEINDNNYYNVILGGSTPLENIEPPCQRELSSTEKNELRERISLTINNICNDYDYDQWGELITNKTFSLNSKITPQEVQEVLDGLEAVVNLHVFDKQLDASNIFSPTVIVNNFINIPMENVEHLLELFNDIKSKYSEYMPQFLNTACKIINDNNYEEPNASEDIIPF